MVISLVEDLAIIAGLSAIGMSLAQSLIPRASRAIRLAIAFPLGGGLFTYLLFLLSWAGLPLTPASVLIIFLVALGGLEYLRTRRALPQESSRPDIATDTTLFRSSLPNAILLGALGLVVLFECIVSVGQAYAAWDAVAMWGIKGYGIALEGTIFAAHSWGAHALAYPLNIHLLIALFKMLSGDMLPGSKLIFPLFLVSAILGCYGFWRRRGVSKEWATGGCLLLASVPVLFTHATNGYANLPTACYLVLAALIGAEAIASGTRGGQFIAGLLLGLACWTIVEGMFFAVAVLGSLLLAKYLSRSGEIHWLHICLPALALGGIWLIFYVRFGASGSQAMGAADAMFASFRRGEFELYAFRMILGYLRRTLFDPQTWGFLFSGGLIMGIFGFRKLWLVHDTELISGYMVVISTGILSALLFYLRFFVTEDFYAYLIRGFPRESFQTAIIFVAVVVWASGSRLTELMKRGTERG